MISRRGCCESVVGLDTALVGFGFGALVFRIGLGVTVFGLQRDRITSYSNLYSSLNSEVAALQIRS